MFRVFATTLLLQKFQTSRHHSWGSQRKRAVGCTGKSVHRAKMIVFRGILSVLSESPPFRI